MTINYCRFEQYADFSKFFKAILFLGIALFYSCTNNLETVNAIVNLSNKPVIYAKEVEIVRTDSGEIVLKGYAKESSYYKNKDAPYLEFNKGFKVETFVNYPIVESSITADYAKHFENKKMWIAKTNVIAQNLKGEMLNTELLYWDENKHIIYSDKF
ncbi:MAG: LPS export ABC transporter periplasmic protein LptC, partial [Bacteroidetes bacterium CG_4_10_14_3_um_filter_31_20]